MTWNGFGLTLFGLWVLSVGGVLAYSAWHRPPPEDESPAPGRVEDLDSVD